MKQLIAGLVISLGVLQGAQADAQMQSFNFDISADTDSYSASFVLDKFDSTLGRLTGYEWGYSFYTTLGYTITNNGNRNIDPLAVSAQGGSVGAMFFSADRGPFGGYSAPITGSNSFSLTSGQEVSGQLIAVAKGEGQMPAIWTPTPLPMMMPTPEGDNAITMFVGVTSPFLSVGGRNLNNVSISSSNSAVQGSAYFSYIYEAAPVPEPETYAMFLAGLGLIGTMARRRKSL